MLVPLAALGRARAAATPHKKVTTTDYGLDVDTKEEWRSTSVDACASI